MKASFTGVVALAFAVPAAAQTMSEVTVSTDAAMPELPAVAEAVPGFEVVGWYGVVAPAKMAAALASRLNQELVQVLNEPAIRERIVGDGSEPVGSSPEEFRRFMHADLAKWAKLVKESGAKLN
jgi:tripartite-type tricarboxylate transporter receptor subunit TctC